MNRETEELTVPLIEDVKRKTKSHSKMDYTFILKKAWEGYDASKSIREIEDISAMVSTNHVFRITFHDDDIIIAKLSHFGKYEYFKEDHRIIHSLSNNLLYPFENLLAKSLLKNNRVYIYRHKVGKTDAWVVFYNPTRILERMPRRLEDEDIKRLGQADWEISQGMFKGKECIT